MSKIDSVARSCQKVFSRWPARWTSTEAVLGFVVLSGFAIRLYGIVVDGFVDDDTAYYTVFGNYYRQLLFENYPHYFGIDASGKPGIAVVTTLLSMIIGSKEFTLPFANAFFAVGNIILAFKLASLCSRNRWVPVIAATLVSFVPFLIELDRTGLPHTPATFFVLLSLFAFLHWFRFRYAGDCRFLIWAGICFGIAILFHPTVLIYSPIWGSLVLYRAWSIVSLNIWSKVKPVLTVVVAVSVPILLVEAAYRMFFLLWPDLLGSRTGGFWLHGYLQDLYQHYVDAAVASQGTRHSDFIIQAWSLFRTGPAGWLSALSISIASVWFVWRARQERASISAAMLLTAYIPLILWNFSPNVGQLARALHATLPLCLIMLSIAVGDLACFLAGRYRRAFWAEAFPLVVCALIAVDGAVAFLAKRAQLQSEAGYEASEMRLPHVLFADLHAAGIDRVYFYDNGFYKMHWWFLMNKYFNAPAFFIENANARPEPDVRMISDVEALKSVVSSGKARLVIMRRPLWEIPELYRKREEDFLSWAPKLGGKQWTGFGRISMFPPNLFVYEFTPSKLSVNNSALDKRTSDSRSLAPQHRGFR